MKTCLISSGWIPIKPGRGVIYGGGIEAQVYGLAGALTDLCREVHVITVLSDSYQRKAERILYHQISAPSQSPASTSLPKLMLSDILFAYRSTQIHRKLKTDVVHCHTKLPAACTILDHGQQPMVFTAHNWKLWEGVLPEWKSGFSRAAFELDVRIERLIARRSDVIIALSEAMKKGIVTSTGIDARKVAVVSNAVDSSVFYPEKVRRTRVILYVGRITAEKGVDILVKAMPLILKEVPDTQLIIVGPKRFGLERGGFQEQLHRTVRKLGIERSVFFAGTLSIGDLRKAYSQAWLSCLPAVWQEPFGLTLIEALACETPVIGTRVGGISEVISQTQGGLLVRPGNVEALAESAIRILSDASFAQQLGRRGREAVRDKFTFERQAAKVYAIYSRLLE